MNIEKETIQKDYCFYSPVYITYRPEWINKTNTICDKIVLDCKNRDKQKLKEKQKIYGKIGDHGWSYHSSSLINCLGLEEIQSYIGKMSYKILNEQGFDLTDYSLSFTEFWVQEFGKKGGGHHDTHTHYDNHISGFYFLKCSNKTSYPVFHDPRAGSIMTKLPEKKEEDITLASSKVNYVPKPGTFIFFNSYLPHQFVVDNGVEPFRFIHFNIQAIRKNLQKGIIKI
jgi:uncharacterized protein (TIGR02466 family)